MPESAPRTSPQLEALTGLRFFAALHVLLYHVWLNVQPVGVVTPAWVRSTPAWVRGILDSGYVSVGLFFVLSGFILTFRYLADPGSLLDRRAFWTARFARIYPVYLFSLAFSAPLFFQSVSEVCTDGTSAGIDISLVGTANLTLLQAWVPRWACWWNCPGWSLSVEAFFYAVFPWLGAWLIGLEPGPLLKRMGCFWLLALAAPTVALVWLELDEPTTFLARLVMHNPLLRLPEFLMGIALGRLFLARGKHIGAFTATGGEGAVAPWERSWGNAEGGVPLESFPVGAGSAEELRRTEQEGAAGKSRQVERVWVAPAIRVDRQRLERSSLLSPIPGGPDRSSLLSLLAAGGLLITLSGSSLLPWPLLHNGLLAPLFALLIYGLAGSSGPLSWLLSRPALVLLGEASYALYLLHLPLWQYGSLLLETLEASPSRSHPAFILVYMTLAIGLAIGVYKGIEKPARRRVREVLSLSALRK